MSSSTIKDEKVKYGLFVVKCMNVGDDIQSLAALRFIPKVDINVDRDRLYELDEHNFSYDEQLKIIMNGWYIGGYEHWPPKNKSIRPLLTSIHINPLEAGGKALDKFISKEGVEFLRKFGPVGARDKATLSLLEGAGVESYFSGCMTLTLNGDKRVKRKDFILAINVSDEVYACIVARTSRKVIRMDVERTQDTNTEENLALARYYLYMYQSAHCIVTTRLHATLPTIAIGGRVLFILESNGDNSDFEDRFDGLYQLANHLTPEEFITDSDSYDINNPPENPSEYKKLRKNLEDLCIKYTGYDNKGSYMSSMTIEEIVSDPAYFSAITKISEESWESYKFKHRLSVPKVLYDDMQEFDRMKVEVDGLRELIKSERQTGIVTSSKRLLNAILFKLNLKKRA